MRRLLLAVILFYLSGTAIAADWYIRQDGGDYYQCDGKANAPFTGVKRKLTAAQRKRFNRVKDVSSCALNNPFFLQEPGNVPAWRTDYHGGDTVHFMPDAAGNPGVYELGLRNPHTGKGLEMATYYNYWWCNNNGSGCAMPAFPNGTQAAPTRWLGPCYPDCSNANGTDVKGAAKFVGINGIWLLVDFSNTEWVEFSGFELTQYTQCTKGQGTGACVVNQDDYVQHAIQFEYLVSQGPANVVIRHVSIHGISAQAILGSHLNRTDADKIVLDHLYIRGDGLAGLDQDGGGCNVSCLNVGRIELTNSYFDFVGCVTPYNVRFDPATGLPDSVNYCKAQQTGGYGDAIPFIAMASAHVYMNHDHARYNTQDGYDLLHMGDVSNYHPILEIYNSEAVGNMGQTFKIGGGGADSFFLNNFANSNCKTMTQGTAAVFSGFPVGWNKDLQSRGDYCRAYDNVVIHFSDGRKNVVIHNVLTGYASPFVDILCSGTCTGQEVGIYQDNIMYGYPNTEPDDGRQPAGFYFNGINDPFTNPQSHIDHNLTFKMRSDICAQVPQETDCIMADPGLANEISADLFNPKLLSTTAAVYHNGVTAGLERDFYEVPWLTPPSRGLSELNGNPVPPAYDLANTYQVQMQVAFRDASGQPTTPAIITWSVSDPTKCTITPDSVNKTLAMFTPLAGQTGSVQVTARADSATATFAVNITASTGPAPATSGTITIIGTPQPIPGRK